jgi:hypothetical protein
LEKPAVVKKDVPLVLPTAGIRAQLHSLDGLRYDQEEGSSKIFYGVARIAKIKIEMM